MPDQVANLQEAGAAGKPLEASLTICLHISAPSAGRHSLSEQVYAMQR